MLVTYQMSSLTMHNVTGKPRAIRIVRIETRRPIEVLLPPGEKLPGIYSFKKAFVVFSLERLLSQHGAGSLYLCPSCNFLFACPHWSTLPRWVFAIIAIGRLMASGICLGINYVEGVTSIRFVEATGFGLLGLIMFWGAIQRR